MKCAAAFVGKTRLDVRPGANGGWDILIDGRYRGNFARRATALERGRRQAMRTDALASVDRMVEEARAAQIRAE